MEYDTCTYTFDIFVYKYERERGGSERLMKILKRYLLLWFVSFELRAIRVSGDIIFNDISLTEENI